MAGEKKLPVPKEKELWLMGFRILVAEEEEEDGSMRKSWSMGNLSTTGPMGLLEESNKDCGYLSEGNLDEPANKNGRKRGIPWTVEEHRTFLKGLERLGKGDWRGISKNYVTTRTPTQVASHAQKYFLRQMNPHKRKRRSSLFDVATDNNWQGKTSAENPEFTFRKTKKMEKGNGFPTKDTSKPNVQIPLPTQAPFSSHEAYTSSERIDGLNVFSSPCDVGGKVESKDSTNNQVASFETKFLLEPSSSSFAILSGSGIRTQELLGLPMDTTQCNIQEIGSHSMQCNDLELRIGLAPPNSSLAKQVHSPSRQGTVSVV